MNPESVSRWVAVQVRSRSEQLVETLLRYKGYRTWSPCMRRVQRGGRLERAVPLFPGYVFCELAEPASGLIVTTPGVLRFVGPGGRPSPVDPAEIASVQAALASGLAARPAALQPGSAVEVVAGPLRGCSGVVLQSTHGGVLLLGISLLQRAVAVMVENEWLRPLPHYSGVAQSAAHTFRTTTDASARTQWRVRSSPPEPARRYLIAGA